MSSALTLPATPRLSDLAAAATGRLHGTDRSFAGVGIDTRRLQRGDVFVALHGAQADGHAHVAQAADGGAAAAVVERRVDAALAQIEVIDTQQALQQAGAAWRQRFDGPVVGITGSNGKTTVRRMLTAILAQRFAPVLASSGNFNNHLGVPLTLLRLRREHNAAVIEMGASHAGEIDMLAGLTQPTVGLITNAGDAHLEGFGSRDGVARAKGELYQQLAVGATAIINADDVYASQWTQTAAHCRRLYFSLGDVTADVYARAVELTGTGSRFELHAAATVAPVTLAMPGEHNVRNALAAAAAAVALGVDASAIAAGLAQVQPTAGRLALRAASHGARVVDDSYNANPVSLNAALDWLALQPGQHWLVLGDMGELGASADAAHRAAGERAAATGVARLWATGAKSRLAVDAFGAAGHWYADHDTLGAALEAALAQTAAAPPIVLVKGSRSAHMDRIATRLTAAATQAGASC